MQIPDYSKLSVKNMHPTLKNDVVVLHFLHDYRNKMLPNKEFSTSSFKLYIQPKCMKSLKSHIKIEE